MISARTQARPVAVLLGVGISMFCLLSAPPAGAASPAAKTPIKHLVFLQQADHTFDNYFGTRPGVDGLPASACQPVRAGSATPCTRPFHLASDAKTDVLRDSGANFAVQYNRGRMDGFVSGYTAHGNSGRVAMGYYDRSDLPYYQRLADEYVLFDKFFSSAMSGSVANHMFAVAAQPGTPTARGSVPSTGWGSLPTIFDRLQAAGVSWKFYVQNYKPAVTFRTVKRQNADVAAQAIRVPLLSYARFVDDPQLAGHIVDMNQYYADLAAGTLPAVSYISSSADSEHPPGSIQSGQRFTRSLITGLQSSTAWKDSAFVLSYDSAGGWYDHVVPPQVDRYGYGFRVPALLVSPYARKGRVDHSTLDSTSVLKFIEDNWSLPPLSSRDAGAKSIAVGLDLSQRARDAVVASPGLPAVAKVRTGIIYALYGLMTLVVLGFVTVTGLLRGDSLAEFWAQVVVFRWGRRQ